MSLQDNSALATLDKPKKETPPSSDFGTFQLEEKVSDDSVKKTFRLANRKLFLTYPGHLTKQPYIEWFTKQFGAPEFICLAHETGNSIVKYLHSHVLIDMGATKKITTRNVRALDYSGDHLEDSTDFSNPHPNIHLVNTMIHWDNSKRYIAKEDPENSHLTLSARKQALLNIRNCTTQEEFIEKMIPITPDGTISAISFKASLEMYEYLKDPVEIKVREPTYTFQKWFMDYFSQPCLDDRHIHWFYDPVGCTGKSTLSKFLSINQPKEWIVGNDMTAVQHTAQFLKTRIAQGWTHHGIINNLSRSSEDYQGLCKVLECVKDGIMFATKYESQMLTFNSPHLAVFANYLPPVGQVSFDRWIVYKVEKKDNDVIHYRIRPDGETYYPPVMKSRRDLKKELQEQLKAAQEHERKLKLQLESYSDSEDSDTETEDTDLFAI